MSVFVENEQLTDMKFYVKSDDSGVNVLTQEQVSKLPSSQRSDYEECHVFIRPLTWGASCDLQSQSMAFDMNSGHRYFDTDSYVRHKMKAIIGAWSFTTVAPNGESVPVPVSEEAIDRLHPAVADFILKQYNERFEMTEKDRKNS